MRRDRGLPTAAVAGATAFLTMILLLLIGVVAPPDADAPTDVPPASTTTTDP